MNSPCFRLLAIAGILVVEMLCPCGLRADDWPQWRGPNRDGIWKETGILQTIPASGLKIRWRAKVSNGYSGPVVAQGRVFVTDRQRQPELERVLCFDEATGKPLWVHSYACTYEGMEYGNGPRAAPTVYEGKVYTLGTQGDLLCLDASKGNVLWQKSLVKDYNAKIPRYGASAAPLVVGDLLIICAGGKPESSVVALDRNTGKERWKALKDRPAYSAPIVITAGGCQQLIAWTADNVTGFDPATGKIYWQVRYKTTFDEAQVVASPVLHKDLLLCLSAWNRGSFMLRMATDRPAASLVWKTRNRPTTQISTPLFQDDRHFYAIELDGSLCCIDATSGDEVWNTREATSHRGGTAHLTANGDQVFLFNQKGDLILARLTSKGYQEKGRCLLVEPTAGYRAQGRLTWAHPAYANKHVFARNDREVICATLAAEDYKASDLVKPAVAVKSRLLGAAGRMECHSLAISPDGKTLALCAVGGIVKVFELSTGKELPGPPRHKEHWVCCVAFSPDGKLLVSAGGNEFMPNANPTNGEVKLWDVGGKTPRGQPAGHTNKVFTAAFSRDNKTLATGSADKTVRLWDATTAKEQAVLRGHSDAVRSVAFFKDGKTLVSASLDQTVRLWDVATAKERAILKWHDDEVFAVAISPDGKTLATGSADRTVHLWDLATEKEFGVLKGHRGAVLCLAFTSDSKTLASGSGDETVKLWDVATAMERMTLRGHRSSVSSIAIAPNDRTLASAGMDDPVRLWDLTDEALGNPKK